TTPIKPTSLRMPDAFRGRRLYTTVFTKDGKRWNRLRLGFYPTLQDARNALPAIKVSYPGAWVAKTSAAERQASASTAVRISLATAPAPAPAPTPQAPAMQAAASVAPTGAIPAGGPTALMDQAAIAVTAGDYQRAVLLYSKVLQLPDKAARQQAQELLGLARERNGQLAHAKAEYETYLQLYPEGEGADRVRQRLAGLLTARSKPQEKLRGATKEPDKWQSQIFGGFSQSYSHDASSIDGMEETVNRSDLNSDLDLNFRLRNADYELGARFNGGYVSEFRKQGEDVSRINTLYLEAIDRNHGLSSRIGRQSRSTGGVFGRFDGAVIDYQFLPRARLSLVGGFPVDSSKELEVDPDRRFYGAGLDFGTFADKWDFNLYGINQEVDGIIDRQAVGGEVRYFNEGRSVFSLVDYDVSYKQLNIALLSANWVFKNQATAGLTLNYRNSPSLATTNAIQGQGVEEVSDLLVTLTEEEVRALAEDRTARSQSATINASHPLGKSFQVSGDITISNLLGTEASGGVPATPGTGNEFFYSTQLIGSSLLMENDVHIFGLRYSDTENSNTSTFSFDARYPLTKDWRLNPRLRADFKQNNNDQGEQVRVRPSLRTDYRPRNWFRMDFEAGMEWTEDHFLDETTTTIGYNVMLGYRVSF
ncbi:MAG: SPOR domain-containing protein, partial [Alphaproteobacteria bacterium]|nr:SPOR domain-containing protein [Alphaproteobacteria bacterium]